MRSQTILVFGVCLLAACGGGADVMRTESAGPGGGTLFSGMELPATSELNGLFPFTRATRTSFNDANQRSLTVPTLASAYYEGTMLARKGNDSEFLHGDIGITFDFTSGSGSGTGDVTFMSISGSDTQNRQLSVFDNLDVLVTSINGSRFEGTLTGTVEENTAVVDPIFDDYTVNADLDGRFVGGGVFDGMVGTVDGTISSTIGGSESLDGVFVGEEDPFGR